jgi:hypothetical protein
MLHSDPQYVSSSTLLIFSWTNCVIVASGIFTHCKEAYSMQVQSGLHTYVDLRSIRAVHLILKSDAVFLNKA